MMLFSKFSEYLSRLEMTASRNKMTVILAELLKKAQIKEVDKVIYLSLGKLGPRFAAVEFNLAGKMMIRVLAKAYGIEEAKVKQEFKKAGDLGETISQFKIEIKNSELSVNDVYFRLLRIAQESGEGSVERKIGEMAKLLNGLDGLSAKYVVRITLGRLRLGFSDMTILDALSWMLNADKSKRIEIERAYNVRADVGQIARIIKLKGLKGLESLRISLGTPVMPALCQRLPTVEEMIKKMGKVAVEPKYDGQRLQVHFERKNKTVKLFTRNLEDITLMFPDVSEALFKEVKAESAILDGEVIGVDPKTGKFLDFQETIKRKRKYQVTEMVKEIPIKFFCFDIIYKDGRDLLKTPFNERRKILEQTLSKNNKTIVLSPQIVTADSQRVKEYHDEQIKKGLEGVVLKKWKAPYDPGKRGYTWVKFKSEGRGRLVDTLDCVVMGYYSGKGKRTVFGIGAFLVGIRKKGKFLTISKIGTGLTDKQWRQLKLKIKKLKLKTDHKPEKYIVDKNLYPDVWCSPSIVVEIDADNITKSPLHSAGLALRFPRLVRFRDYKSADEATTVEEVRKLYKMQ